MSKSADIKAEALAHYDRMIAWAEQQPMHWAVSEDQMADCLGESWDGVDCAYCKASEEGGCCDCPLQGRVNGGCCDGLWEAMDGAHTWGQWVTRARLVQDYIRAMPIPEEDEV